MWKCAECGGEGSGERNKKQHETNHNIEKSRCELQQLNHIHHRVQKNLQEHKNLFKNYEKIVDEIKNFKK